MRAPLVQSAGAVHGLHGFDGSQAKSKAQKAAETKLEEAREHLNFVHRELISHMLYFHIFS